MFLKTIENHGIKLAGALVAIGLIAWVELSGRDVSGENMGILWLSLNAVVASIQAGIKKARKGEADD